MRRYKDEPPAIRVYTVCDESKYLIVRNVPALGCGDELKQLFATYGEVEECKPMDAEDCEPYTDVYWIKFHHISNARFAKRKLDESVFLGNRLQVSYAPDYESLSDTKEKLDVRSKEVLARLKSSSSRCSGIQYQRDRIDPTFDESSSSAVSEQVNASQRWDSQANHSSITRVSSDQDYFPSQSMNATVQRVRETLTKIESSGTSAQPGPALKKSRVDNRRRI